ncbi:MAG: response regulator [Desulfatitalea sp.]|nr:response regulator [Desulfatitalea sp.]NNK02614.1 response regulator [Desulfatitalea sp.]
MNPPLRILLVEDNPGDAELIQEMLPAEDDSGFAVHWVGRLDEAVTHLKREKADLALLDLDLPDSQGIETIRQTRQAAPRMPIVVLTGHQDDRMGLAAVQCGAQDFLVKGQTHGSHLSRVLRYAIQRHYAEEKIRESEHFLRSTLDALSAHIAIIDASGRILTANKAWKAFSAKHGDHIMRSGEHSNYFDTCRDIANDGNPTPTCAKAFADGIRAVLQKETNLFELEYAIESPDGKRWFQGQVTPFPNGNERNVVVSHEDITARKLAEGERIRLAAQLRHVHKMEAIGTLAGGIAHDFNNILASVLGYVELSLLDLKANSQLEENLREVYRAGLRAKELVKQILTFARKGENLIQPTQISAIAKETTKLIQAIIPASISVELISESDSFVMAEPTQIHQVFMNLLTNAAQAMDSDGGTLTVKISDVHMEKFDNILHQAFEPGDYLKITVSDTGVGIASDKLEKIFDPYFTTKGIGEGSGLGLSVVLGIVRNHCGEIEVSSMVGQGTTFAVYLPLSAQQSASEVAIFDKLPAGTERILFIDDEQSIAQMSQQRLSLLGYRVTAVNSSMEALRQFTETPACADLVITDMNMPHMSGEQLAMKLKQIRPDLPIILCTGYSHKISEDKANRIGINAFLMKPISMRKMAETIRKVLEDNPV